MKKDFEFDKTVNVIKQCDALVIDDRIVVPVIDERTMNNGIRDFKTLVLSWDEKYAGLQSLYIFEDEKIMFDGQTFEITDRIGNTSIIAPLLKLRKWEDY